ncbi:MAG: hypothetical protein IKJ55_00310, partial [Clostridia bacterium]|nr:hypothetical protein [Clostridia bacterium]
DEFEGDALNTDIWMYRPSSASSSGKNLQENIRVENGKMYIDYRKVGDVYTGGGIITRNLFPYGYYETKALTFTGARGLHTSFWISTPGNPGSPYYPQRNHLIEVDGFEFDSRQDGIAPNPAYALHYWWGGHDGQGGKSYSADSDGDNTTNEEFVMGFEILPGKVIYYSNGVEVGRKDTTIYSAENVWLTALAMPDKYLLSDGTFDIDETIMDENGYFGSSEYDYFRYYQKKLKGVNLLANGHFEFNRLDGVTAAPRSFYRTGTVNNNKTPFAHSGFCAVTLSGKSVLGKNLMHLVGGNYTFEGYFKVAPNTDARMVVYDKNDVELKSLPLSETQEWKNFSIPDILVTDSAYVVVEVTEGMVMADDLNFFSQDGEEGYEDYRDTDYEKYAAVSDAESNAINFYASEATAVGQNTWTDSSAGEINNEDNLYGTVSATTYQDVSASWTHTMEQDGIFDLEVFRIVWNNNIPKQYYTVTVDGVPVLDSVETITKNGSDKYGEWTTLGTLEAKKGQTVTITVKPGKPDGNTGLMRICPLKMISHDELLIDSALIMQINNPIFQYKSKPYAFDQTNTQVFPYLSADDILIPYQALKSILPVPSIAEDTTYVTATQLQSLGDYKVMQSGSHLIVYSKQYTASDALADYAVKTLAQFKDHFMTPVEEAVYAGKGNAPFQQLHTHNEAELYGSWGSSSLGHGSSSRYTSATSATADWKFSPESAGRYMVQFYSIAHKGEGNASPSTVAANINLSVSGFLSSYTLNQFDGQEGWYTLATLDLTEQDLVHIQLSNGAASGLLRACAVRLVPVFEDSVPFYHTSDRSDQTYFSHQNATATENWTNVNGVYTSDNPDATVTYTIVPAQSGNYRVQIYQPDPKADAAENANIYVKNLTNSKSFLLNQTTAKAGWYDLGIFSLSASNPATVLVQNLADTGTLYSKGVRLIPDFEAPAFVTEKDALNQEYYSHTEAEKVGAWQNSGGVYEGCCTAPPTEDNQNASITWTVNPKTEKRYSVQVYVPKQTDSGAKEATALLNINGNLTHFTLYQRADSAENTGTGWYDLGSFDFKPTDVISVELTNRTFDGWLRAKAIRLVPALEEVYAATTENTLLESYFGKDVANTSGSWTSDGEIVSSADQNASISWTITPKTEQAADVQIYLPQNTASDVQIYLELNGKYQNFTATQKSEGWYSLGKFDLKTTDTLGITMSNAGEGVLYAKAVRLLPATKKAVRIANFNEPNQELWSLAQATKTGTWKSSGGEYLSGTQYGMDSETEKATITWNLTPLKAQKYSVQFFVPCYTVSSTTAHGYATLTVDGKDATVTFSEYADPAVHTGWYELGVFDLSPDSTISLTMGKTAGSYLRAKAVRLIPYPGASSLTKDGTTVTANIGTLSRYQDTFLFAEFTPDGILQSVKEFDTAPTVSIPLTDASNSCKLFFWDDQFNPVTLQAGM